MNSQKRDKHALLYLSNIGYISSYSLFVQFLRTVEMMFRLAEKCNAKDMS